MKDRDEKKAVERVARAISNGVPVDWAAERDSHGELPPSVENLLLIRKISEAYGSVPAAQTNGGDSTVSRDPGPGGEAGGVQDLGASRAPLFTWGHLQVLEKIGEGGFAEVFRAWDPNLRIEVALKLPRPDRVQDRRVAEQFIAEARRLARIPKHPQILVVHGAGEHDGRVGMWTDLVRGKTLSECVHEQGTFSAREATLFGLDLCCALSALHITGIVHRDVKPSNVMRKHGGQIVLMDFGSAGPVSPSAWSKAEGVACTPLATAPEVLVDHQTPTPAADIYGLGVLLYWLVSGRYPVEAQDKSELIAKHRRGQLVRLLDVRPDVPPGFCNVVERALEPDPTRRWPTAGEMARALEQAAGGIEPPRKKRGRAAFVAAALAAVGLAVAAVALTPRPFAADVALYSLQGGSVHRLTSGSIIAPGDHLFLEVEGSKAMHVYVFGADDTGTPVVLFPAETAARNPLAARVRHRLPGPVGKRELDWLVSPGGAVQTILVVASPHAVAPAVAAVAMFAPLTDRAAPPQDRASPDSIDTRGLDGRVVPHPPVERGGAEKLADLQQRLAGEKGVRLARFELPIRGL